MNICLLAPTYHPMIGGAETYARTIAEGMANLGHTVMVLTDGARKDLPEHEIIGGVEVIRLSRYRERIDDPTKVRWEQMYFSLLWEIEGILRERKIDIIHTNSLDTALFGSMAARTLGIPIVCTVHEQTPETEPFGPGKCKVLYQHVPLDLIIAGSLFYLEKATSFGAGDRARLIYHGIDLSTFSPEMRAESAAWRDARGIGRDEFLVVSAARLKERKGLLELIRAIHLAREKVPNIRGVLAGSCNSASREYADLLYAEIEKLGLDGIVQIDETLSLDDMPAFYRAADLVAQPSHAEGLGLAVLEGMACGKPVVATDVFGIQEIITHEQDGLLVPPCQVEPLAEAIVRLAADPAERERLAAGGLATMKARFDILRQIEETERAYREVLS